jgi:hypothetical protein
MGMSDPTSVPNLSPAVGQAPPAANATRDRVVALLDRQNLSNEVDGDGDVEVIFQDQRMFIQCVERELTIVRVFGQWLMDDAATDELQQLRACNAVTGQLTVVKASVTDGVLVASAEHILPPEPGPVPDEDPALALLLYSSLELVLTAVARWNEVVRELAA